MKKNLFWSLIAATALLTACNDDAMVTTDNGQPATGAEVPVGFAINLGNPIDTYAADAPVLWSEQGGWSNFKANSAAYAAASWKARATIQIYQGDNLNVPIATETVLEVPTAGDDVIAIPNIRLQAGAKYRAMVWVDFVQVNAQNAIIKEFYDVATDGKVSIKSTATTNENLKGNLSEMRDAYTQTMTFTVSATGTFIPDAGATASGTTLNLNATRVLSKLRFIMTDFKTKAEWKTFFTTTSSNRILDYVALKMTSLTKTYDPFNTSTPFSSTIANVQFHQPYATASTSFENLLGNMKWVDVNGKSEAEGANTGIYPVIDCNYFFPVAAGAAPTLKMFAMGTLGATGTNNTIDAMIAAAGISVEGGSNSNAIAKDQIWRCISFKSLTSIPLEKNCLTTIKGNFLTVNTQFNVTVKDAFDKNISDNNITINDDNSFTETTAFGSTPTVAGTLVTVSKDSKKVVNKIAVTNLLTINAADVLAFVNTVADNSHNSIDLEYTIANTFEGTIDYSTKVFKSIKFTAPATAKTVAFKGNTKTMTVVTAGNSGSMTVTNVAADGTTTFNPTAATSLSIDAAKVVFNAATFVHPEVTIASDDITLNGTSTTGKVSFTKITATAKTVKNSKLSFATGCRFGAFSSNIAAITFNGVNYLTASTPSTIALTGAANTQELIIMGNPDCRPANDQITVTNSQKVVRTADSNNVWEDSLPTNLSEKETVIND